MEDHSRAFAGKESQRRRYAVLEIRKIAISLDEAELLELERIVTGDEDKEALVFLKKSVYEKVKRSQKGKLKAHLDTGEDPVERFNNGL